MLKLTRKAMTESSLKRWNTAVTPSLKHKYVKSAIEVIL